MYILVIDQGSHSSRALVFDSAGSVLASSTSAIKTRYPQTACVEQSPDEILQSIFTALRQLETMVSQKKIAQITSAALIVQRSSLLACDKALRPLTPVISWQDTRNQALITGLFPGLATIKAETGLRINAHYGASKMRWLLDNDSHVKTAAQNNDLLFVPLAAYIASRLVSATECVVDPVIASRTLLTKLGTCEWSAAMLELFAIDRQWLPRIVRSDYPYGNILFAGKSLPLKLVGGDQSFVAFACGLPVDANAAYVNVGTGAFVQMLDEVRLDSTGFSSVPLLYSPLVVAEKETIIVAEGTVNAAATALDWLWETEAQQADPAMIEQAMLEPHKPPVFINTLAGTGSPYWLPAQTPVFIGEAGLAQKAIAVLESIVFALMDNLQLLQQKNPRLHSIVIGGGLSRSDGFCQKLANLAGLVVNRPQMHELSARGAAFYLMQKQQGIDQVERDIFRPEPDEPLQQRYGQYLGYIKGISRS